MADPVGFLVDSRLALSAEDLREDLGAPSVTIRIPNRVVGRQGRFEWILWGLTKLAGWLYLRRLICAESIG